MASENAKINFYCESTEFALKETNSNIDGLRVSEASERLKKYGANELPQKRPKPFILMLLGEFLDPIVLILLFAMAFSFIVGEVIDAFVILGIVSIDALLGAIQEKRSQRIAKSLSGMIKVKTKVLRDGQKLEIDSKDLVVGDIVFLESGDKVCADMRILEASNLTIDEALLTGESLNAIKTVEKVKQNCPLGDRTCMAFSGSSVITGRAKCVVVGTGLDTEIGTISTNLNNIENQKSPLEIRINKFSKQIAIAIVSVAVILFVIMLLRGNEFKEILLVVIALAVSAMPEGLPLAVTMALTIASNRMGKHNVVVKHLNAVESLGSCTVIATDKTGTLTLNEQTAKIITLPDGSEFEVSGSGYNDDGEVNCYDQKYFKKVKHLSQMGMINNEASFRKIDSKFAYFGDSIDIAFKVLASKIKVDTNELNVIKQIPYESENKYSAVFFKENNQNFCTMKGSLEKVLESCENFDDDGHITKLDKDKIFAQNESLAKRGYRVIALAYKQIEEKENYYETDLTKMTFLGLVGFIDPVRPETKGSIEECHRAGIKVIMITGDHPLTAYSIAKDINIATNFDQVATGINVQKFYEKGEKEFDEFVKSKTIFSRVTPSDKLHIVESLKRQGEFVAVTGDGVNDSPAIKSAHIGIAMGSGTDVSKETADMIILNDDFTSIVAGVKEGRCAYANIRKITYFLISSAIAEVVFFIIAMIGNFGTPLLPIQLLWLNVVTDGLQDISLSLEKPEKGLMFNKPRSTKESLFSKSMVCECVVLGITMGTIVFGAWLILLKMLHFDIVETRTFIMALMVFMQNFHAINCKSEKYSIFKISHTQNWFFMVSIAGSIGLQLLFMEVPVLSKLLSLTTVSYGTLLILLAISLVIILVSEIYKIFVRKKEMHNNIKTI